MSAPQLTVSDRRQPDGGLSVIAENEPPEHSVGNRRNGPRQDQQQTQHASQPSPPIDERGSKEGQGHGDGSCRDREPEGHRQGSEELRVSRQPDDVIAQADEGRVCVPAQLDAEEAQPNRSEHRPGTRVAVEDAQGTNALLERVALLRRDGKIPRSGGVLVKCLKPQQDGRHDLPTIGPETAERAARAGLVGVAAEAGRAILVGRDETIDAFCRADLFLVGLKASPHPSNG